MKRQGHKSDFHAGRQGRAYKNGKLYEFSDKHVLVMKGWPDPRAWLKRRSHGWIHTRKWADDFLSEFLFPSSEKAPPKPECPFVLPDGQMILPGIVVRDEWIARVEYNNFTVCAAYFDRIPEDVRQELLRYRSRRWHLLNVFARCPGAMDLSHSNPALLYALASNWAFHLPAVKKPMRAVRELVWKKQRAIQEWLGFPGTEPVRRMLAKISADALDVESLLYLRRALEQPECLKLLGHLKKLNRTAVMMASDRRVRNHVTPRLIEEVLEPGAGEIKTGDVYEMKTDNYRRLVDTVRMAELVNWEKCPRKFHSVKRIQAVHDEIAPRMEVEKLRKRYNIPDRFHEPPFKGTEHIVPLRTPEEMFQEGHMQKNCVGSHVFSVMQGKEYVYRVEQPVRATLAVVYTAGSWVPDEFQKSCNRPVDDWMRREVFGELFRTRRSSNSEAKANASAGG